MSEKSVWGTWGFFFVISVPNKKDGDLIFQTFWNMPCFSCKIYIFVIMMRISDGNILKIVHRHFDNW